MNGYWYWWPMVSESFEAHCRDPEQLFCFLISQCRHWRIQDLPKGRGTMASAWSASLNGAPPAGSKGRAPGGGPLKLKPFYIFMQKNWPKIKDLSENLPPRLSRSAMTSPNFWSMGAAAPTAHSWIRH